MKTNILFITLLLCLYANAASSLVGKGQFETKEGDKISFVKRQLLFSAIKNVMDKEFERLNLDKEKFWLSYEEKFNEYFKKNDDNLKAKFKITEKTPIDDRRYKLYNKSKRMKLLTSKRKFWGLSSLINSYSVKNRSQSISKPGLKFITIQAKLNESLLRSKYYKLLKTNQVSGFTNLYLKSRFQTSGFSWDDFNVDQSDFKSVVNAHWTNWITENYSNSINNVIVLNESDETSLNSYIKSLALDKTIRGESEYDNSLLLEVNVSIKEVTHDETKKNKTLELNFDSILVDLSVNKIISTASIRGARSEVSLEEDSKPGSVLASFTYNKQIEKFSALKKDIATYSKVNNLKKVVLNGHKNLLDIYKLIKQINTKGVKYRMKAELESFTQDRSTLIVFFSGDDKILEEQILNSASGLGEGKTLTKSENLNESLTYNFVFSSEVE
jgi:hypothetical protein